MPTHDLELVAALSEAVARRIGPPRWQLWFDRHTKFTFSDGALTVGVPNRHFEEWLQRTFRDPVADAAAEVCGAPVEVRFVIDPELFQAARREQARESGVGGRVLGVGEKTTERGTAGTIASPAPSTQHPAPKRGRRWRKLSDFVIGPCNRVAHAAAVSSVEEPGEGPNPLVLHGPVGTGKTHLLEGVYAGLRRSRPDWRVCFVSSEDFTNRFVQAMRLGKLSAFRKQFRDCDALLVDDLHFLATRKATQEELLHTLDALQSDGRPVVVTSDCHPRLADDFGPELTDRLLGGAIWGLTPPDAETRLAVLRARSLGGAPVPEAVLRHLAAQLRGNVRELEGALNSLRHYSRVTGRAIDLEMAREALADLLRHAMRVVQVEDVDRAVCAALKLEAGALQSKGRSWAVSHPRMLAMYLARRHTAASYSDIGGHFGGRNHSTTVAAEKKVRQWLAEDTELALGERRLRVREVLERAERELLR
jgi:chromosomal replication initiator protein